jgi:3-methyl-2-oxobutanoate hydroxymethyltransferase
LDTRKKVSVNDILATKRTARIAVLTAYDYSTAAICDRAGVDILLVGDSASMVMLGHSSTIPIGMNEMMIFCNAVARGSRRAMVVGDMPFGSYQASKSIAVENAALLVKSGCDAVKLEGGAEIVETVRALVDAGIPVMGHIGLKPQTSSLWEGYKVQGRTAESALRLLKDARALRDAGAFSVVLEMVASEVANEITKGIDIPTIGIGSGSGCDGQVLVLHDMLGIYEDIRPRFVKRYAQLSRVIQEAVSNYSADVRSGKFPEESQIFHMDDNQAAAFRKKLGKEKRK